MSKQAIGIFDSGIGGLTVAKAIKKELPQEQILYFGDTAHLPYGDKSADAIRYYSIRISKFLLEHDCKMIVIACHSASSVAYQILKDFFDDRVQFVNVVDPLVHAVASLKPNKVGIIATRATIKSNIYAREIQRANPSIKCNSLATPLLVPMIEEGFSAGKISDDIIDHYLGQESLKGIEALLLACTHYPLIREKIVTYYSHQVEVLDSTKIIAQEVQSQLAKTNLLSDKQEIPDQFFVSNYTKSFADTTSLFYGHQVSLKQENLW